jgi:hypothetical protein
MVLWLVLEPPLPTLVKQNQAYPFCWLIAGGLGGRAVQIFVREPKVTKQPNAEKPNKVEDLKDFLPANMGRDSHFPAHLLLFIAYKAIEASIPLGIPTSARKTARAIDYHVGFSSCLFSIPAGLLSRELGAEDQRMVLLIMI